MAVRAALRETYLGPIAVAFAFIASIRGVILGLEHPLGKLLGMLVNRFMRQMRPPGTPINEPTIWWLSTMAYASSAILVFIVGLAFAFWLYRDSTRPVEDS